MHELNLSNRLINVSVNPDRGAEITRLGGPAGENLLASYDWETPLRATRSCSYGNPALDWLSEYRGGWQELFPNAGAACEVMGTPLPPHGEVSRARWDWEWIEPGTRLRLRCPTRLPLVLEREMQVADGRAVLLVRERIINESALTVPYLWAHHPAFGPLLADTSARIDLRASSVVADAGLDGTCVDLVPGSQHSWPTATGRQGDMIDLSVVPQAPVQRLCYLTLLEGWFALRNPRHRLGVAMAWDLSQFPYLWLWQEIGGGQGLPWYGRARITALEPASQYPAHGLAAAIQAAQARHLPPHGCREVSLACALFPADERPVTGVSLDGEIETCD